MPRSKESKHEHAIDVRPLLHEGAGPVIQSRPPMANILELLTERFTEDAKRFKEDAERRAELAKSRQREALLKAEAGESKHHSISVDLPERKDVTVNANEDLFESKRPEEHSSEEEKESIEAKDADWLANSEDKICPITSELPMIPVRLNLGNEQLFELGKLLHMLYEDDNDRKIAFHPITRQPFTLMDFSSQYEISEESIARLDRMLAEYGSSRKALLAHYNISPELYEKLLTLDFYSRDPGRFNRLREYFQDNFVGVLFIAAFVGTISSILFYLTALKGYLCESSTRLDEKMYNAILNTFEMQSFLFPPWDPHPIWENVSRLCVYAGYKAPSEFSECRLRNFGLTTFESTPPGQSASFHYYAYMSPDNLAFETDGIDLAALFTAMTTLQLLMGMRRCIFPDSPVGRVATFLSWGLLLGSCLLGLEALRGGPLVFKEMGEAASTIETCVRACNAPLLEIQLINGVNYTTKPPEMAPPICDQALSLASAGVGLLVSAFTGPLTLFSRSLFGSCRRKTGDRELKELRDQRHYDYLSENKNGPRR